VGDFSIRKPLEFGKHGTPARRLNDSHVLRGCRLFRAGASNNAVLTAAYQRHETLGNLADWVRGVLPFVVPGWGDDVSCLAFGR
jgi:hypothetical protein